MKKQQWVFKDIEEITCASCKYYNEENKVCLLKNVYIPSIGYEYWQYCDRFNYEKISDDLDIVQNVNTLFHSLPFTSEFMKLLSDNLATEYIVKGRVTEILYTGLGNELIDEDYYDEIEDLKKTKRKYSKEYYEMYPITQQYEDIERYLKNIIVIALDKHIPLRTVFEPTKTFLKRIHLIHKDHDTFDLDMPKQFRLYEEVFSRIFSVRYPGFKSSINEVLGCTHDDIFNMTDEERTKRLLNLLENEWRVVFLTRNHFYIENKQESFIYSKVDGQRRFNKEKNKFEFSIVLKDSPFPGFPNGGDLVLYSETDNGLLITLYLEEYMMAWDLDINGIPFP